MRDHGRVRRQRAETRAQEAQIAAVEVRRRRARREDQGRVRRDDDEEHARGVAQRRRGRIDARDGRDSEDRVRHEAADERRGEDGSPLAAIVAQQLAVNSTLPALSGGEEHAVADCKCDDVGREGQRGFF